MPSALRLHRSHIVFVLFWMLLVAQLPIGAFVEDPSSLNRISVESIAGHAAVLTIAPLSPVVLTAADSHTAVMFWTPSEAANLLIILRL
jgi:hypothetical protein